MRRFATTAWRLARAVPLLLVSPFLLGAAAIALSAADLVARLRSPKSLPADRAPANQAVSVVIPNWNGRDLLEKYLPSVIEALSNNADNEIVLVDNGSTDGSADFVRTRFPALTLLALPTNLGFGGGSNAGFRAAKNDIVVLLNSDMRVAPGFLAPLLAPFTDPQLFAVSCQIFFSDPGKVREESGLTQGWWDQGALRVRHRIDNAIHEPYPCFYGGGGSCAFDRHKFLELGGFDHLYAPFYLEDTDLGYLAWKRGWKVLYEPNSAVFHEHRGTIGKKFSAAYIDSVIKRNFILFAWKNIHDRSRIVSHLFHLFAASAVSLIFGQSPERPNFAALARACWSLPAAVRARIRAQRLSTISDAEAFRRPLGAYYRDRFAVLPRDPQPIRVLFLSPYPIYPPTHGGAVFMSQTVHHLLRQTDLHLIVLLDYAWQREAHHAIDRQAQSTEYIVRMEGKQKAFGSIFPHAVTEFANADLEWLIHRQMYLHRIDVLQIEYTALAQYGMRFQRLACILFEHDVYFQSIGRQWPQMQGAFTKIKAAFEYLRAIRYELGVLHRFDRIQVCSPANGDYLTSFIPKLAPRIDPGLRAGIDTSSYRFEPTGREPFTMLFLGSFRHTPNQVALQWFLANVLPTVVAQCPQARLVVVGSDPPPRHSLPDLGPALELRGFVEEVREPLSRYALFVCPILSGSGMRVKLLEAFAAGIPVVSTRIGAEGLAMVDGELAALADDPAQFAHHILDLFQDPGKAHHLAVRARRYVEEFKDMSRMTDRLTQNYRAVLFEKRTQA